MTKASRVWARHRIAGIEVVLGLAYAEHAEHTAWITQFKGDGHDLKGK